MEQVRRDPHDAVFLLLTPIDVRYIMYFGDKDIYYALVDRPHPLDPRARGPAGDAPAAGHLHRGAARAGPAAADHREAASILLIHNAAANDPDGKLIYRAGQALIDPAKPTEELARLTTPWLVPETPEEIPGQVNNVVFVEGLVAYKRRWFMYYGQGTPGSASSMAVAGPAAVSASAARTRTGTAGRSPRRRR